MKHTLEYESETALPKAILDLFEKYEDFIQGICRENDKLCCFMAGMRRELLNWFIDHQVHEKKGSMSKENIEGVAYNVADYFIGTKFYGEIIKAIKSDPKVFVDELISRA